MVWQKNGVQNKAKDKKPKGNVAKDGHTILRVELYNHFGKHTLRPYVVNGCPIFLPKSVKKEKKYYKTDKLIEQFDADHNELCRRINFGLSMKASNLGEFMEFAKENKADIQETMNKIDELVDSARGKALQEAVEYIDSSKDAERTHDMDEKHIKEFWKFYKDAPEHFERFLRNGMMWSTRAFLGFSSMLECYTLIQKHKAWAKKIEPKSKQPKAVKQWLDEPGSEKKAVAALIASLRSHREDKKKKNKKTKLKDGDTSSSEGGATSSAKSSAESSSSDESSNSGKKKRKNSKGKTAASKKKGKKNTKKAKNSDSSGDSSEASKKRVGTKSGQKRNSKRQRSVSPLNFAVDGEVEDGDKLRLVELVTAEKIQTAVGDMRKDLANATLNNLVAILEQLPDDVLAMEKLQSTVAHLSAAKQIPTAATLTTILDRLDKLADMIVAAHA